MTSPLNSPGRACPSGMDMGKMALHLTGPEKAGLTLGWPPQARKLTWSLACCSVKVLEHGRAGSTSCWLTDVGVGARESWPCPLPGEVKVEAQVGQLRYQTETSRALSWLALTSTSAVTCWSA